MTYLSTAPARCHHCETCGVAIQRRRYCSRECYKIGKTKHLQKSCAHCLREFFKRKNVSSKEFAKRVYCSKRCRGLAERPRTPDAEFKRLYREIKVNGRRVMEHRWVMEQSIGRRLRPEEQVHHINHNGLDNRIENLELVSTAEHGLRHTFRPITTICAICGIEFTPLKTQRGRVRTCGRQCGYKLMMRTRRERAA